MNDQLRKLLDKKYDASSHIDLLFKGNDLTIITNADGIAVTLFIGKRKPSGDIKGERYVRNFKSTGSPESSHWDNKGKVG